MKKIRDFFMRHRDSINLAATAIMGSLVSVGISDLSGWISIDEISKREKLIIALVVMGVKVIISVVVNVTKKRENA
jgi:hypothetical protein